MKTSSRIIKQWAMPQVKYHIQPVFNRTLRLLPIAVLLALVVFPLPDVHAASIVVDLATDTVDPNDGKCSLREAITAANTNTPSGPGVGECLGGDVNSPDTVNLTPSATYNLTNGELTVSSEIVLNGNRAIISAGGLSRILMVDTGADLSLYDVTLRDGVGDEGGAIHSRSGSTVNIFNSAIVDNSAISTPSSSGGGINNWGGTVNITNSTISGNRANAGGGGIANLTAYSSGFIYGTVNLINVTITNNTADAQSTNEVGHDGGGIFNFGVLRVKNSIIAKNFDNSSTPGVVHPDCANWLNLTTQQYNLIGNNAGCDVEYPVNEPTSYFPPGTPNFNNDIVGSNDNPSDPMVSSLTGNPPYHPLLDNSPAIDNIPLENCTVNRDQPGATRPYGPYCDIGAVEAGYDEIPGEFEWNDICVPQRMEITGIGMGDFHSTINPQTLSLDDPANLNWLLAQMAGRKGPTPNQATFTTDAPQSITLTEPNRDAQHSYTFETNLQPAGQVTVSSGYVVADGLFNTPRGLILYGKRAATDIWSSVGKTTNVFVYRNFGDKSHTESLTFPPLTRTTDLFITAVVIDNDNDSRPMVVEAIAGGVTESVTELGPTNGTGLNIVNLTLPQVPAGTDQASITLRSPSGNGDSLVLVGLNVSFPCAEPTGAMLHVVPSPTTIPLGATGFLSATVTPGSAQVNAVQIHGRVDPTYLRLVDIRPTGALPTELDPVAFDPATGQFRYGAGLQGDVITEPFDVAVLEVQAIATTTGTLVEFLDEFPPTDISGPNGSVMEQAQDGLVIVTPGLTLQGAVDMQGRPSKPAPSWAIPLTVSLTLAGNNTPPHNFTTTTDENGEFALDLAGVTPGLYDIRVKGNHTLRNLAPNLNMVWGDNHYFFNTLLEGDVETAATFNQVAQPDADMLIDSFNTCQGQSGFVPNADLDESSCVLLPDFGLLSGNFDTAGDVVIPTVNLSSNSIQTSGNTALITFNVDTMDVVVDEMVTVTIDIDPRGQAVNGGMVHLSFDPNLVEVETVTLTDFLPVVLTEPTIDNHQGEVRFAAGILGQIITEKFPFATLSLKVKAATTGATIAPIDLFTSTDVSGPQGSVLSEATGITLRTEMQQGQIYLPIIMK